MSHVLRSEKYSEFAAIERERRTRQSAFEYLDKAWADRFPPRGYGVPVCRQLPDHLRLKFSQSGAGSGHR